MGPELMLSAVSDTTITSPQVASPFTSDTVALDGRPSRIPETSPASWEPQATPSTTREVMTNIADFNTSHDG